MIHIANVRDFLVPNPTGRGKRAVFPDEAHVWVGRAAPRWGLKASPLANPSAIRDFMGTTRDEKRRWCIRAYRIGLQNALIVREPQKLAELARLRAIHEKHGRLTLVCACAPKPCHAEEIRRVLLEGLT